MSGEMMGQEVGTEELDEFKSFLAILQVDGLPVDDFLVQAFEDAAWGCIALGEVCTFVDSGCECRRAFACFD